MQNEIEKLMRPEEKFTDFGIAESEMTAIYEEMRVEEENIRLENIRLLKQIVSEKGQKYANSLMGFVKYLSDYTVYEPWAIVDKPDGHLQKENFGLIKEIWIRQWSTGLEGDTYAGYVFFELSKDRFLKVHYSC